MSVPLEQLARNQVFREVNERLLEIAEPWSAGSLPFQCECSLLECDQIILLARDEYERIRSSSNLFVIAPGHETPEVDRISEENERFALVQKTVGAQLAVESDPRKRGP
jgi:hypothetical protein